MALEGSSFISDVRNIIHIKAINGSTSQEIVYNKTTASTDIVTGTSLTANSLILGNGSSDIKVDNVTATHEGGMVLGSASLDSNNFLKVSGGNSGASGVAGLTTVAIEDDTAAGITILTPNTQLGSIAFGDPENGAIGRIRYNHSNDSMTLRTNGVDALIIDSNRNTSLSSNELQRVAAYALTEAGTAKTLTDADCGAVINFTSNSAITVTINTGLASNFQATLIQLGTGTISFAGTATRNGATTSGGQYTKLDIYPANTADTYTII